MMEEQYVVLCAKWMLDVFNAIGLSHQYDLCIKHMPEKNDVMKS